MSTKKYLAVLALALTAASATLGGCAFGNFGKADMTYSRMNVPQGLEGMDKGQVLRKMGVPDSATRVGDAEYWDYNNKCGYYVLLFGKTLEKDLVLDFRNGRIASASLVDKGGSMGLLSSQGAVAQ
jgi:outer membrane protein assembly factor BamE (lipoprotein component of BamABCDE complex)